MTGDSDVIALITVTGRQESIASYEFLDEGRSDRRAVSASHTVMSAAQIDILRTS